MNTPANYCYAVNPDVIDTIYEQLLHKMVVEKRYRDPHYNAQAFAKEIGANVRYVSAAVALRFHQNFAQYINGYRIRQAKLMLEDRRYDKIGVLKIAEQCGFATRQTFYNAFNAHEGMTPFQYRKQYRPKA